MPRKPRPLDRDRGRIVRDASLIIIASEDKYAVEEYFARFKTTRVKFEVLTTQDGRSAPEYVKDRLLQFRQEFELDDNDTLWICIDRNGWPEDKLKQVLGDCLQQKFQIAISNPCWELWLLLHFEAPEAAWKPTTNKEVADRLITKTGSGAGKRLCGTMPITHAQVADATERARAGDTTPNDLLPLSPTTRVYRILEELLAKERIVFVEIPTRTNS